MAKLGYIQVTRQCNQKCIICSNPPTEQLLSLLAAKRKVDEIKNEGGEGIIITGGEPTLYKYLPELIAYAYKEGIFPRIITNGQKLASWRYAKALNAAGLRHLHVSIYSCRDDVQAAISQNADSLKNITKALDNLKRLGDMTVNMNIAISKLNAGHLSETVSWVVEKYPMVQHFVFNNLDPHMNRASENPEVVPRMHDFELELHKSLNFLEKNGKTFRVERVPLCYLAGFEFASTETRKIVKKEARTVYFLDTKEKLTQSTWESEKAPWCNACELNDICAGLFGWGRFYSIEELSPVFIDKNEIIKKIKDEK
ncbi:MAG: radical SAM protein [Candidatus Moranbacteria bacterium]|nr:radical SAM protein [Candidatus Moranbacteria bacterium]